MTVPVSFLDVESPQPEINKTETSGADDWHPDFDALSCGNDQKEKKEVVDNSKNFLPSQILDPDQKSQLLKGYKEILGA